MPCVSHKELSTINCALQGKASLTAKGSQTCVPNNQRRKMSVRYELSHRTRLGSILSQPLRRTQRKDKPGRSQSQGHTLQNQGIGVVQLPVFKRISRSTSSIVTQSNSFPVSDTENTSVLCTFGAPHRKL